MGLVCPKCGGLLVPKKKAELVCRSCGYSTLAKDLRFKEKVKREKKSGIIEVKKPKATVDVVCPKCGHVGALFWMVQTRAADEPATEFYRCIKCSHTWRRY